MRHFFILDQCCYLTKCLHLDGLKLIPFVPKLTLNKLDKSPYHTEAHKLLEASCYSLTGGPFSTAWSSGQYDISYKKLVVILVRLTLPLLFSLRMFPLISTFASQMLRLGFFFLPPNAEAGIRTCINRVAPTRGLRKDPLLTKLPWPLFVKALHKTYVS